MTARSESKVLRVAFQGERGAFSEEAVISLLGDRTEIAPRTTFDALFAAIHEDAADLLLAPLENSLAGAVARCKELLRASDLIAVAEITLLIEQHLIAHPDAEFEEIETVASHPVALAQCRKFFAANPQLSQIIAEDTAGSVRRMMEEGDRKRAAIAGRRAAQIYGAKILRERIHDGAENFTRFALLAPREGALIERARRTIAARNGNAAAFI